MYPGKRVEVEAVVSDISTLESSRTPDVVTDSAEESLTRRFSGLQ